MRFEWLTLPNDWASVSISTRAKVSKGHDDRDMRCSKSPGIVKPSKANSWSERRSKEALRAASVVLVQLLAAVGIKGSDIELYFLQPDNLEVVEDDFFPRSATRRGDELLSLLGLHNTQNREMTSARTY